MTRLTILRIALTALALAGMGPITYLFVIGALFFAIGALNGIATLGGALLIVAIFTTSAICIWFGWKSFALAVAAKPRVDQPSRMAAGLAVGIVWGVVLVQLMFSDAQFLLLLFVSPGITASVLLWVAVRRSRSAINARQFEG